MFRLPWEKKPGFWTGCFVVLGLALRVFHYARNPSMWHDEAALVLNAMGKNFTELLGPLFFSEGALPLFLWIERAVFLLLGDGTYPLRLVPFLASCLSFVLLAAVARRLLAPVAVPWAVLLFACADKILWHTCEAKPYAVDVLSGATLLALYCYTSSWRLISQLVLYTILAPVIIFLTYPGCFLLGGLLVALLLAVREAGADPRRSFAVWLGYAFLVFVVFASFALLLAGPVHAQRDGPMTQCWLDLFAPWDKPWQVPLWTIVSTFELFRYCAPPFGQPLLVLAIIGAVSFARHGYWRLLAVMLVPVLLAFLASCAHAYPYGGQRILVYAAPALFLMVAAGTNSALAWLRERSRLGTLALVVVLLIPAGSAIGHAFSPWGRADCASAAQYVLAHRQEGEQVIGDTWECQYYFRHLGSGFTFEKSAALPLPRRVWILISGCTPQERTQISRYYISLQGQVIEQREYERIVLLLLESHDMSSHRTPTRSASEVLRY